MERGRGQIYKNGMPDMVGEKDGRPEMDRKKERKA